MRKTKQLHLEQCTHHMSCSGKSYPCPQFCKSYCIEQMITQNSVEQYPMKCSWLAVSKSEELYLQMPHSSQWYCFFEVCKIEEIFNSICTIKTTNNWKKQPWHKFYYSGENLHHHQRICIYHKSTCPCILHSLCSTVEPESMKNNQQISSCRHIYEYTHLSNDYYNSDF